MGKTIRFDAKYKKNINKLNKETEKQAWINDKVTHTPHEHDNKSKVFKKGHFDKGRIWPTRPEKSPNQKKRGHQKV